jgi:hypothetical protein
MFILAKILAPQAPRQAIHAGPNQDTQAQTKKGVAYNTVAARAA